MFKTAAALTVALAASTAMAQVEVFSAPNANLAGYTTYTVAIVGPNDLGFNAATVTLDAPAGLNQSEAFGQIGLFADDGLFAFVPSTVIEDTYFLFNRPALLVDGSFGESATGLEASFAYADPIVGAYNVMQVVIEDSATEAWVKIDLAYPGGTEIITVFNENIIPTPATGALFGLAGLAAFRRR
ncbi:hypothetical protein [Mucisphaera calidilacus]|uniref:PEP-CTERM protein-sorting domain-containing protein n=1 Tax=Mucisphaera calidilacus TaxID=2527982 RepID=A0A518BWJ1_9BACT|nr:hypothetical protein [Mucisphaera calidilacus]QDU71337.1 hypothetical protein Pan265_11860 [Mucisphaera calidilacus]